jgi:type VI secretion system protein ImpA
MSADHVVDLEALRQPLLEGAPAGINLRVDEAGRAAWGSIRELRDEARRIERDADKDPNQDRWAAVPIWSKVVDTCAAVLTTQSRDLAVAAALIEALGRTRGFRGLAAGCDVARAMVESHWSELFPIPDPEDGPADERMIAIERALPLVRLAGDDSEGLLVPAILHVPLVDGRDGERFGLCHWRSSAELRGVDDTDRLQTALERGGTSPQQFETGVATTDRAFLQDVFRGIQAASGAWQALADAVASASNDVAIVPTLPLRELFEECETALRTFAPAAIAELGAAAAAQSETTNLAQSAADGPAPRATPLAGVLVPGEASRNDVLQILESVADHFERHDPHSLLAAQVRNVVRMARLPRADYYRELILEESGLQSLSRMAGLTFDG